MKTVSILKKFKPEGSLSDFFKQLVSSHCWALSVRLSIHSHHVPSHDSDSQTAFTWDRDTVFYKKDRDLLKGSAREPPLQQGYRAGTDVAGCVKS